MKKRTYSKHLSILLVTALVVTSFPSYGFGNTVSEPNPTTTVQALDLPQGYLLGEIPAERERSIKHFLKDDGTYEAVIYPNPVHFLENGSWQDIDNRLSLTESSDKSGTQVYKNGRNEFVAELSKTADSKKTLVISKGEYRLEWGLEGAAKSAVIINGFDSLKFEQKILSEITGTKDYVDPTKLSGEDAITFANEKQKVVPDIRSEAIYQSVLPGVDLTYVIQSNQVKENLVLSVAPESGIFIFNLGLKKLVPIAQEDGSFWFCSSENLKEPVFVMQAPYMYDAKGEISNNVRTSLIETNGGYQVIVEPDMTWLKDQSRAYPVTIDPPITTSLDRTDIFDAHVVQAYPDTNYQNSYILKTGYGTSSHINRSYLEFTLPTLSSGSIVTDARMTLFSYTTVSTPRQVDVHKVLADWSSETVTWNNRPSYSGIIEDYQMVAGNQYSPWTFEITSIVKGWYTGGANYGVMIRNLDETTGYMDYLSSDCSDTYALYRPQITLYYVNNSGLEGYWTYHSNSIGRGGTGYVNDYNGNLTYIHTDVSMSGNRLPITVQHVYNSNDAEYADLGKSYGRGWRTNFNQRIRTTTIGGELYYYYVDEDGTKHYFYWDDTDDIYKDENGLNINLTVQKDSNGNTTGYTVEDKGENELRFNSGGYLTKIRENNNSDSAKDNELEIVYTPSNYIDYIEDPSGRRVEYTWNDGSLSSIKDPSGRYTYFHYNTSDQLISIEYPDGEVTAFTYGTDHNLIWAKNHDGNRVHYDYSPGQIKRIDLIEESHISDDSTVTVGQKTEISYGNNVTNFTYTISDTVERVHTYQFNDWGNTVNTKDNAGYASYSQYNETAGSASKNRTTLASKIQKTGTNLLKNHNLEASTTDWAGNVYGTGSEGTFAYALAEQFLGETSGKVNKTNSVGDYCMLQKADLSPGYTYTFTGYVKTSGITSANGKGARIFVRYQDGSGIWQTASSEYVNGTQDWQRLYVTFTLPSDTVNPEVWFRGSISQETGTAYFDCMQVESGSVGNRYSLVENGDFRNGLAYWSESADNVGGTDQVVDLGYLPTDWVDTHAFKIVGDAQGHKYIKQTVNISGHAGDTFVLSGWANGASVPLDPTTDRRFGLMVGFVPASGSTDYESVTFNTDASGWQYAANVVNSSIDYESINVYCRYYDNANTAYFDGIRLFKEEFGPSYTYDSNGNLISNEDLNEENSTFTYDSSDNLTDIVDPEGGTFSYTYYQDTRNLKTATTAESLVYGFVYDDYGNPTRIRVRDVAYNAYVQTNATYTSTGQYLESIEDPAGNEISNSWDETKGLLSSTTDADGKITTYSYETDTDRLAETKKTVDRTEIAVNYDYTDDRLTKITRNDFSYVFGFDARGRNTTVGYGTASPYQNLITNTFQDRTNLILSTAYANGHDVSFTYDGLNRVTARKYETTTRYKYSYDNSGNLGYHEDLVNNISYRFLYDISDRLISILDSEGNVIKNTYDKNSNIKSISDTVGGVKYYSSFTYDQDNRCIVAAGGSGTTQRSITTTFDNVGRIEKKDLSYGGSIIQTINYTYHPGADGADSRTAQIATLTNGSGASLEYTYDKNGNIATITQGSSTIEYFYDELNQLTRENNAARNETQVFVYDEGGNLESKSTYAYVAGEGVLGAELSSVPYTYASLWKDQLASYNGKTVTYDAIGNPTDYDGKHYAWEEGRLLTGIDTNNTPGSNEIVYTYNDQGIRTSKTVNGTTTSYHLIGDRVARETTGTEYLYFNYDGDGNVFCVNYNGTRYFYERNLQGDVIGLLDTSGNKVVTYEYSTWGEVLSITGSLASTLGEKNPYRYRGYRLDSETGMYYLNSRYYAPEWGRFFSPDVVMNTTGDLNGFNLYAYGGNNPATHRDSGGFFLDTILDVVSVCISAYEFAKNPSWKTFGMLVYDGAAAVIPGLPGSATIKATALVAGAVGVCVAAKGLAKGIDIVRGAFKGGGDLTQLQKNKIQGSNFEQEVKNGLNTTQKNVVEQITIKANSGVKTRIDLVGNDASTGNLVLTEAKSSTTAPLTNNQKLAFPEIAETGGVVVGKGKAPFVGGTQIPPTTVQIIRPK